MFIAVWLPVRILGKVVCRCTATHKCHFLLNWKVRFNNICVNCIALEGVWHLITGCHLCVGLTPTSNNAKDLSQYDPGCWKGRKTTTLTLSNLLWLYCNGDCHLKWSPESYRIWPYLAQESDGPPSKYWPSPVLLNFSDQMGTGHLLPFQIGDIYASVSVGLQFVNGHTLNLKVRVWLRSNYNICSRVLGLKGSQLFWNDLNYCEA